MARTARRRVESHQLPTRANRVKEMRSYADLYTECKIDLAWLMPLPNGLSSFLEELFRLDPCLREHSMVFPELWSHVPVVAFELESSGGKHAPYYKYRRPAKPYLALCIFL